MIVLMMSVFFAISCNPFRNICTELTAHDSLQQQKLPLQRFADPGGYDSDLDPVFDSDSKYRSKLFALYFISSITELILRKLMGLMYRINC